MAKVPTSSLPSRGVRTLTAATKLELATLPLPSRRVPTPMAGTRSKVTTLPCLLGSPNVGKGHGLLSRLQAKAQRLEARGLPGALTEMYLFPRVLDGAPQLLARGRLVNVVTAALGDAYMSLASPCLAFLRAPSERHRGPVCLGPHGEVWRHHCGGHAVCGVGPHGAHHAHRACVTSTVCGAPPPALGWQTTCRGTVWSCGGGGHEFPSSGVPCA